MRGAMFVVLRTTPPWEIASMLSCVFVSVMSMNPYWSSCPSKVGASSEVMPPPPPETMYAVAPNGPVPAACTSCWCRWPVIIRSMPYNADSRCHVLNCQSPSGGKCVATICHSAVDSASPRSSHSICFDQRSWNQSTQSDGERGPCSPHVAPSWLWTLLQRFVFGLCEGSVTSLTLVSTK